jgi:DNA-binding CsgD family transcriptional regulator
MWMELCVISRRHGWSRDRLAHEHRGSPGTSIARGDPVSVDAPAECTGLLLERETTLGALSDLLGEARVAGRLVLVGGEAGVGKTALLRRFCEDQARHTRTLWGACAPLRTPRPLGPFVEVAEHCGGELEALVSGGAKPHAVADEVVRELDGRRPTVLVLEDLHWADEATLDVLTLLATRIATVPALVIGTYRDDELERAQPLRLVLGEVVGRRGRLMLNPLSPAAVAELARAHQVDAKDLHRRSGGNPFFVTELLAGGGEQLPDTVRDAVLARAGRLPEPARRLLDAVAVMPGGAGVTLLEAMVGSKLLASLDECLASGILKPTGGSVAFRHELARVAIEESIGPHRLLALHRSALAALRELGIDPARLAHHAEAAGDGSAVLEFAPVAAERAAAAGAHREAAAQFGRALRFADEADLGERAALLERLSDEHFVSAAHEEALRAAGEALECYRALGDRRQQAHALCTMSRRLYCSGAACEVALEPAREAVALLSDLAPCRELAEAYELIASASMNAEDVTEALRWGPTAVALAERLGQTDVLVHALNDLGTIEYLTGLPGGRERLERGLRIALDASLDEHAARAFIHLAWVAARRREYELLERYVRDGTEFCTRRDLELHLHYLDVRQAQMWLGQGRWDEAAETVGAVVDDCRAAPDALAQALAVLALLRARRGDPAHASTVDQALALAEDGGDLQRLGPVVAARAEILWLDRRGAEIGDATASTLKLALDCRAPWVAGELAVWRRRAGLRERYAEDQIARPYLLSLSGDCIGAARSWEQLGCRYEAALARADSDDQTLMREALQELQALGAQRPAAIVARRLREIGARDVPRGPRRRTRANPGGLTARELEVTELLVEGLRNAEIAERLVVASKTVDHHVSAILRKLNVQTRGQAAAAIVSRGLLDGGPSDSVSADGGAIGPNA